MNYRNVSGEIKGRAGWQHNSRHIIATLNKLSIKTICHFSILMTIVFFLYNVAILVAIILNVTMIFRALCIVKFGDYMFCQYSIDRTCSPRTCLEDLLARVPRSNCTSFLLDWTRNCYTSSLPCMPLNTLKMRVIILSEWMQLSWTTHLYWV